MKKLMLSMLGGAALALAACDGGARLQGVDDAPSSSPASPDVSPESPDSPGEVQGLHAELRLLGVNPTGYAAALVALRRVSVTTAEGQALPVALMARTVDLAVPHHAHLLGRFVVPEGVERVRVEVELDEYGGFEQGASGGVIDARAAPLRFEAPVAYLRQRGRAVLHLDVERSLRARGEDRLLLPSLSVHY